MQLLQVHLIGAVRLRGLVDALNQLPVGAALGAVLWLVDVRREGGQAKGEVAVAKVLSLLLTTPLKVGPDALEAGPFRDGVHRRGHRQQRRKGKEEAEKEDGEAAKADGHCGKACKVVV